MENELPKIDLPIDCIAGINVARDLLNLYIDSPCRLKAGIFVLLLDGDLEASINLVRYKIPSMSLITILPQSILQVHSIQGNPCIYFLGFSSEFLQNNSILKIIPDYFYRIREMPIIELEPKEVPIFQHFFTLSQQAQINSMYSSNPEISMNTLHLILLYIKEIYKKVAPDNAPVIKSKKIAKDFSELVIQYYSQERNVSFYAERLKITPSHLSATIKEITGKTCTEIISAMVIMDAKTQLRSTDLSVNQIADSLHFCNVSFFGKYFKRYVGMSPLEYRKH